MNPPGCPDVQSLLALVEEAGLGDGPTELMHHLETCPDCQRTLTDLAAGQGDWEDAAQGLVDVTRQEPTLQGIVENLKKEDPLCAEEEPLSFLRPSDKAGVLGLLGPYEVIEECGRGGMGIVLKALDPALNRVVAIKVLSPRLAVSATARRRFVRESRAAAAVCHEHIVTVHGVFEEQGLPYFVMQYVAGESLQDRLDRLGRLAAPEVVRIAYQAALALAAAHAHDLIHRDVKPANILLEESSDRVKLTDFGLARLADDSGLTQNGVVAGTPEYMAPEQARGERVDHRADLFSLGSLIYAMTTGQPPFHGGSSLAVLRKVCDEPAAPLRTCNADAPDWLEALVARLLAKDREDRFQSAAEVASLLEACLSHLQQPTATPPPEVPAPPVQGVTHEETAAMTGQQRFVKPKVWFARLWVLAGAVILLLVFWAAGRMRDRFHHDFRGRLLPGALRPFGPEAGRFVNVEPEGLRIALPDDRNPRGAVGVALAAPVSGDFEITATVEILQADEPPPGSFGAGVLMRADETARMGRLVVGKPRSGRGNGAAAGPGAPEEPATQVVVWDQWVFEEPKPKLIGDKVPCEANVLQLRMKRTGSTLSYYWAPGASGGKFQLLHQGPFRTDDVKVVELMASTASQSGGLDARFLDLRVSYAPSLAQILCWVAGAAVLVVVGGLVGRRFVPEPTLKERSENPSTAASDLAAVMVKCPHCQKRLKAGAKAVGKTVTCPGCAAAFVA
jgi:Protein kinase domain/Protein of unknown function (DUF1583)